MLPPARTAQVHQCTYRERVEEDNSNICMGLNNKFKIVFALKETIAPTLEMGRGRSLERKKKKILKGQVEPYKAHSPDKVSPCDEVYRYT